MTNPLKISSHSTEITWSAAERLADVRYAVGARLKSSDGVFLTEALAGWIGAKGEPFAVLADASGLCATNADYRAIASRFFRQHRYTARIALINLGPLIHVVVELFRLGTVRLKTFSSEADTRSWLGAKAISA